jgi:hypothetical protein
MKTLINTLLTAIIIVMCYGAHAQSPIVQVNTTITDAVSSTTYTANGANNSSYSNKSFGYSFGKATQASGHNRQLNSFVIGGDEYNYIHNANSYVKIRRVNNAVVKTNRQLLWVQKAANATDNKVAVVNPYDDNMETVFGGNSLNQGTDNLFANQGDGNGNNNNIERLDVIFAGGIISEQNNKVGFALFERGNDNEHDPFVIAAITEVDVNGNPTAYGNPLRVGISSWGNLPGSAIDYYVVRRDPGTENSLRMSTSGKQNIGGVFVSFSDLGINTGVKIYGYSIFAYDLPANATSANLVDFTNPTYFPTNTSSATMQGGIDLIALTGLLSIPEVVILPPVAYNIQMPAMLNTCGQAQMLPLEAEAASGDIASYTIETIPATNMGEVVLCNELGCTPVTEGQVLTPEEINHLFFRPSPGYTGDVVFYYHATDTHGQVSNTASYTIPVTAPNFGPLPVRLTSFSGSINKKTVQLSWQTTQEANSSYYEVQRSSDGSNFEPVATITAKGNTNSTSTYKADDDLFFYQQNKVFYRLKMVDTDGKFKYSATIQIRLNTEAATATTVKAWPNPFTSQLNTEYYSEQNGSLKISFLDVNGKTVAATSITVTRGRNSFALTQAQALPKGTYLLQLNDGTKTENIRIIKQ